MREHKKIPLAVRVHRQGVMAITHHEDISIIPYPRLPCKGEGLIDG